MLSLQIINLKKIIMNKFHFLLLAFIMMIFCSSSLYGQNEYRHIPARGVMSHVVHYYDDLGNEYCFRFDIVCNNCIIDGNIYQVGCPPDSDSNTIMQSATYHIQLGASGWEWGHAHDGSTCQCIQGISVFGIPVDSLINLVLHPDFPLDCCQGNGNGDAPCDTTEFGGLDFSDIVCNNIKVACCNDTLKITVTLYKCGSEIVLSTITFTAIYLGTGDIHDINNYNILFDTPEEESLYREILDRIIRDPNFSLCN